MCKPQKNIVTRNIDSKASQEGRQKEKKFFDHLQKVWKDIWRWKKNPLQVQDFCPLDIFSLRNAQNPFGLGWEGLCTLFIVQVMDQWSSLIIEQCTTLYSFTRGIQTMLFRPKKWWKCRCTKIKKKMSIAQYTVLSTELEMPCIVFLSYTCKRLPKAFSSVLIGSPLNGAMAMMVIPVHLQKGA